MTQRRPSPWTLDRSLRSAQTYVKFSPWRLRLSLLPAWVKVSVAANGLLSLLLLMVLLRSLLPSAPRPATSAANAASPEDATELGKLPVTPPRPEDADLGPRHQLSYQQWVEQLTKEAEAMASQAPKRLTVLAGDSISLWFPVELLPSDRTWLNQGISGETSAGLLKRLSLFDKTKPETIFVLIGINDLIRGIDDPTLLDNQTKIIQDLKANHPQSQIVVQSILPHATDSAITWEGRDRLAAVPNDRIRQLNDSLEAIARQENVYFLDLSTVFADEQGALKPEFTTDGLHLSAQGYQTWSTALKLYSREVLEPDLQRSN